MGIEWIFISIFQILVAMGIFAALIYLAKYIVNKGRLLARFKKVQDFKSSRIFSF